MVKRIYIKLLCIKKAKLLFLIFTLRKASLFIYLLIKLKLL